MEKKSRTILSSMFARIVAFFILAITSVTGVGGTALSLMLWEEDAYTSGVTALTRDVMRSQVVWDDVYYVESLYQERDTVGIENYLSNRNAKMEIYDYEVPEGEEGILLWSNYDGFDTNYSFSCFRQMYVETVVEPEQIVTAEWKDVLFRVHVDDTFPHNDEYRAIYNWCFAFEDLLYVIPVIAIISMVLFFASFIFLMCSAGHHRGQEGITGGVLYFFHFDVVTAVFGLVAFAILFFIVELTSYGGMVEAIITLLLLLADVVWCTIYCMDLAVELKKGTLLKHTLIWWILRKCGKGIAMIWRALGTLVRGLPLVTGALLAYGAFSIVQFFALLFFIALWSMDGDVLLLCFLEKIILLPIVIYFALVCKKLQQGSEALAEGNLIYKLDTSKMILGFKEHGENLNRIGEGIAVAVDERMKSEHLKTELITNVSHDLKTPLTSIINYADLIGTEAAKAETAAEGELSLLTEYSEVLLRQSKRLKKLLEDLVEASKATTGNLEVNLVPCEVGVILSQAIGEYVQRFAEKELELLVKQPEEPVNIQADGRHLWRVFDNLMNNICKYAQEGTRVYLTVNPKEDAVEIIFRNMSKYALDVSADELQERFVRGDKSRHMEGNGLGLSIAGSLVELQNGQMEIVVDGDLFKVILRFPVI